MTFGLINHATMISMIQMPRKMRSRVASVRGGLGVDMTDNRARYIKDIPSITVLIGLILLIVFVPFDSLDRVDVMESRW
jgi:hypothetical protein